jgi:hypothetical protein
MKLLLSVLSVLAGWALLAELIIGLLAILKPLERIRTSLQQIAMGVRAIEQETAPLGARAEALAATLSATGGAVEAAAASLAEVDRDFDAAAPALRPR